MVLRAYFWFSVQGSSLVVLKYHIWCQGLNQGQPHGKQVHYPLYYLFTLTNYALKQRYQNKIVTVIQQQSLSFTALITTEPTRQCSKLYGKNFLKNGPIIFPILLAISLSSCFIKIRDDLFLPSELLKQL